MTRTLTPHPLGGKIAAIASKSQAHRYLICAALADGVSRIRCDECSADIDATVRCLNALGASISYENNHFTVQPIQKAQFGILDCGESGSTLRFLIPVVAALGCGADFVLHGRLAERPLSPLQELLEERGIVFTRPQKDILHVEGKLRAGQFPIAGNVSSQFISGLLFAFPLMESYSEIMLTSPLESAPYAELTLAALRRFGVDTYSFCIYAGQRYHACECSVEGDWSNAAFWLCAGAISQPVRVTDIDLHSVQGDRKIVEVLERFGAGVERHAFSVSVFPLPMHGIEVDASDIPDLVPPIALLAACAEGTTRIFGAKRLKIKESDRLQSVSAAINALGGKVTVTDDGLIIEGTGLKGGTVDSQNDHRIAMLAAIASSVCQNPVTLHGSNAVAKSYPRFWQDFEKMKKCEPIPMSPKTLEYVEVQDITPFERDFLGRLRARPPLYLGNRSLERLSHFIDGYIFALWAHGLKSNHTVWLSDMNEFTANHFEILLQYHDTIGMILQHYPDDGTALNAFFEILDAYLLSLGYAPILPNHTADPLTPIRNNQTSSNEHS